MNRNLRLVQTSLLALVLLSCSSAFAQSLPRGSTWNLDLSAGVPKLHGDEFKATGSLSVGYASESFGGQLWANGGYYDFQSGNALADWTRGEAYAEGYWVSGGLASPVRLEVRVSGGAAYYDSSYTGTSALFTDETSTMGRGSLLLGTRLNSSALQASLLLGAGAQMEDYSVLTVASAASKAGVGIDDSVKTNVRGEGRFRLRWVVAPQVISLRLQGDGNYFSIRRADDSVRVFSGKVETTGSVSVYKQFDMHSRFFVDLDVISFLDISPCAFAGLDLVKISGTGGDLNTVVPVFGVGLSKPVW